MIPIIAISPAVVEVIKDISIVISTVSAVKGGVDSKNAEAVNRFAQEQNDKNLLRLEACSDRLEEELEKLGKQRVVVSKNFKAFIDAFTLIHGTPNISSIEKDSIPKFDFEEIRSISFVSEQLLTTGIGIIDAAILTSVATTGIVPTTVTMGAIETEKFVKFCTNPLMNSSLTKLGESMLIKEGSFSLSKVLLNPIAVNNVVTMAAPILTGLLMAYSGSVSLKKADEAKQQVLKNEKLISECIQEQMKLASAANAMKIEIVNFNNKVYKPCVIKMQDLVRRNSEWKTYTVDEKIIVENCILAVQILHHLCNVSLCIASEDRRGNLGSVRINESEIGSAIKQAKENMGRKK